MENSTKEIENALDILAIEYHDSSFVLCLEFFVKPENRNNFQFERFSNSIENFSYSDKCKAQNLVYQFKNCFEAPALDKTLKFKYEENIQINLALVGLGY